MGVSHIIETAPDEEGFPDREGAIQEAVALARLDAIEGREPCVIRACIGDPCPPGTSAENCGRCEIITVCPDGKIERERKN